MQKKWRQMGKTDLWAVVEKVIIANDKMLLASVALKHVAKNFVSKTFWCHSLYTPIMNVWNIILKEI